MNEKNLPSETNNAWKAYTDMCRTKQQHMDYLRFLEEKYEKYGEPNASETHELNQRLQVHDRQVAIFRTTLQQLKHQNHNAHQAFIAHLAKQNSNLDG